MMQNRKAHYHLIMLACLLIASLAAALDYVKSPTGSAYAQNLANKTGLSNKYLCFYIPNQPIAFDTIDQDILKDWNKSLSYAVNPQNLSVEKMKNGGSLRQRFIPSEEGSERVIAVINVENRKTYELKQSIFFEEGFDWGTSMKSGKFGFGLGGGSAPTGGRLDKDGFTARLAWRGLDNGTAAATLYLYSADRSQNLPYGDEIKIQNYVIPTGTWFDITIRLTVNSELHLADGKISVEVNDELLLERPNIQWQSEGGQPAIDRIFLSSFHGGNTVEWSPNKIVYAQFANACLYD